MSPTWYFKSDECEGCGANTCAVPAAFDDYKCPCILCIVKPICSIYCDKYCIYKEKYDLSKEGTIMGSGKQLKLPNVNSV